jgi:hypothetical protein
MYKDEIFENAVLIGFDARQGYLFLIAGRTMQMSIIRTMVIPLKNQMMIRMYIS